MLQVSITPRTAALQMVSDRDMRLAVGRCRFKYYRAGKSAIQQLFPVRQYEVDRACALVNSCWMPKRACALLIGANFTETWTVARRPIQIEQVLGCWSQWRTRHEELNISQPFCLWSCKRWWVVVFCWGGGWLAFGVVSLPDRPDI